MISSILILQLITAVSMYCDTQYELQYEKKACFKRVWACGHNTVHADVMPSKTHNCVSRDLEGKLDAKGKIK